MAELDHLATRMRRNAENLIILSGSEPARRWRGPIALIEVVRAAVGEIKEHTRVELLPMDRVELAGHAAADLMHLLAELIENAVSFSAPGTQALVAGQPLPAGYLIEIEDQGLGMSDEQLVRVNERLAGPPDADFALAKMLGFFVVSQLAAKHGIRVQLRHSWYGGVTALVLLPADVILRSPTEMAIRPSEPPHAGRPPAAPDPEDPGLAWVDSRVPMVHVPVRRPPDRPPGGPDQPS
jgi:signal transduction histidine kinase